ncbi:MAG: fibrobacter succinogenes major paralogous domain-containing protein [bacterium]|nr:fibrobacter succinogenes major paralogous domain-containing protein [bacterium]
MKIGNFASKQGQLIFITFLFIACTGKASMVEKTDKDGTAYKTIKIGNQEWMSENLNVEHYRNGDLIPQVQDADEWAKLTTGAWCYYENNSENGKTYGKLYNWYAVNDSRGLAPAGWHVPSDSEWTILTNYLGGDSLAGGKMKASDTTYWKSPNTGSTNESGFSALPGGCRGSSGKFYDMGNYAFWWSTAEVNAENAWNRHLSYISADVSRYYGSKICGYTIRCVKN